MNPLNYMRLHDYSSRNSRQHWINASNGKISHLFKPVSGSYHATPTPSGDGSDVVDDRMRDYEGPFPLDRPRWQLPNGTTFEGVSKVLMCYDRPRDGRKRNTCIMARHNDHPSATLPQLSRHRYRPTWEDPSRQATLSLPREGLCGSHLPAGVCLCRSIARGEATDCRYGHERQWHSRYGPRLAHQP